MEEMIRFGVSISPHLLEKFDGMIARQGYTNRSEAIRDLIRDRVIRRIAEKLISTRGVKHGKLTMTTIGEELV